MFTYTLANREKPEETVRLRHDDEMAYDGYRKLVAKAKEEVLKERDGDTFELHLHVKLHLINYYGFTQDHPCGYASV